MKKIIAYLIGFSFLLIMFSAYTRGGGEGIPFAFGLEDLVKDSGYPRSVNEPVNRSTITHLKDVRSVNSVLPDSGSVLNKLIPNEDIYAKNGNEAVMCSTGDCHNLSKKIIEARSRIRSEEDASFRHRVRYVYDAAIENKGLARKRIRL